MPVLTVRISEKEKTMLSRRAKKAGVKSSELIRQFITEEPFDTAEDLLAEVERRMGDKKLMVHRR